MSKKRIFTLVVLFLVLAVFAVGMFACTEKETPDDPKYVTPSGQEQEEETRPETIKKDEANDLIVKAISARKEYYSVPDTADWFVIDLGLDFAYNDYLSDPEGKKSSFTLDVRANIHLKDNAKSKMLIEFVNTEGITVLGIYYQDSTLYLDIMEGIAAYDEYSYYLPELNLTAIGQKLDTILGSGNVDLVSVLASIIAGHSELGELIKSFTGSEIQILGSSLDQLLDGLLASILFDTQNATKTTLENGNQQLVGVTFKVDTLIGYLSGTTALPSFININGQPLTEISWTIFGLPDFDPLLEQFLGFSLRTIRAKNWPKIAATISAVNNKKTYTDSITGQEKQDYVLDDIRIRMDAQVDESHPTKEFDLQIDLKKFNIRRTNDPTAINLTGKNLSTDGGEYTKGGLLNLSFDAAIEVDAGKDASLTIGDLISGLDIGTLENIPITFGGNTESGRTFYQFDLDVKLALDMFNGENTQAEINFNYDAGSGLKTFLSLYLANNTVYIDTSGLRDQRGEVFSLPNLKIENINVTEMLFGEKGLLASFMQYLDPKYVLPEIIDTRTGQNAVKILDENGQEVNNSAQNEGLDVMSILKMLIQFDKTEDEDGNPVTHITLPLFSGGNDKVPFEIFVTGDTISSIVQMLNEDLSIGIPYVSIAFPLSTSAYGANDDSVLKLEVGVGEDITLKIRAVEGTWIKRPDFTYQSAEEIEAAASYEKSTEYSNLFKSNNYNVGISGEFSFEQNKSSGCDLEIENLIAGVLDKLFVSLNVTDAGKFTVGYNVVGNINLEISDALTGAMLDEMSLSKSQLAISLYVKQGDTPVEFLKIIYEGTDDAIYIDLSNFHKLQNVGTIFKILGDNLPNIKISAGLSDKLSFANPFKGLFGQNASTSDGDVLQVAMSDGAFNITANDILDLASSLINGIDIKDNTLEVIASAKLLNALMNILGVTAVMPEIDASIGLKIIDNTGEGFLTIDASILDKDGNSLVGLGLKPLTKLTVKSDPDMTEKVKIDYAKFQDFEDLKKTLGVKVKLEGGLTLKGNGEAFGLDGLLGAVLGEEIANLIKLQVITADTDLDLAFEIMANIDLSGVYTSTSGQLIFPNIGRSELSLKVVYTKDGKENLLLGVFVKNSSTDTKGSTLYFYAEGLGIGNLVIENVGDDLFSLLYPSLGETPSTTVLSASGTALASIGNLFNADAATSLTVNATLSQYSLALKVAGDVLTNFVKELLGGLVGKDIENGINLSDATIKLDTTEGLDLSVNLGIETLDIGLNLGGLKLWFGDKSEFYKIEVPSKDADGNDIDWTNKGTISDLLSSIHVSLGGKLYIENDASKLDTGTATIDLSEVINGALGDIGVDFKAYLEFLGYTKFELNLNIDAYLNFNDLLLSTFRVKGTDGDGKEILDVIYEGHLDTNNNATGNLYVYTTLFGISEEAATEADKKYFKIENITDIFAKSEEDAQSTLTANGSSFARNATYETLNKYIDVLTKHSGEIGLYLADGSIGVVVTQEALVSIFKYLGIDLSAFFDNYNLTVNGELGATPLKLQLAAKVKDKTQISDEGALGLGLEISDLNVDTGSPADLIPDTSKCTTLTDWSKIGVQLSASLSFNAENKTFEVDDVLKKVFSSSLLQGLNINADLFEGIGIALGFNGEYNQTYKLTVEGILDLKNIKDLYLALTISDISDTQILKVEVFGEIGSEDSVTVYVDVKGDKYKIVNVEGIINSFTQKGSLNVSYDGKEKNLSPVSTLYGLGNVAGGDLIAEVAVKIASDRTLQTAPIVVDVTSRAIYAILMGLAGIDIEKYFDGTSTEPSVKLELLGDQIIGLNLTLKDFLDLGIVLDFPNIDLAPTTPTRPDMIAGHENDYVQVTQDSMKAKIDLEGSLNFDAVTGTIEADSINLTPVISSLLSTADFGVLINLLQDFGTEVKFKLSASVDIPALMKGDWTGINGLLEIRANDGRILLGLYYKEDTLYLDLSEFDFGKVKMDNFSTVMSSLLTPAQQNVGLYNADTTDPEVVDAVTRAYINIRVTQGDGLVISVAEDMFKLLFASLGITFNVTEEKDGVLATKTIDLVDVFTKLNAQLALLKGDDAISLDATIGAYTIGLHIGVPSLAFNKDIPSFSTDGYGALSENSTDVYVKFSADLGYNGISGTSYDFTEMLLNLVKINELAISPVLEILQSFDESLTLEIEGKIHYGNLLRDGKLLPDLLDGGLNIDVLLQSSLAIRLVNNQKQEVISIYFVDGTLYVNLEVLGIGKFYIENAYEYVIDLLSPYLTTTGDMPLGYALPQNATAVENVNVITRFINIYASPEKLAVVLTTASIMGILDTFGVDISTIISEDTLNGLVDLEVNGDLLTPDHLLELILKLKDPDNTANYLSLHIGLKRNQVLRLGKEDVDKYTIVAPDKSQYSQFNNADLYFKTELEFNFDLNDYKDGEVANLYGEPLKGILSTVLIDFAPIIGLDIVEDQSGVISLTIEGNVSYIDLLNEIKTGNITLKSLEAKISLSYQPNGGGDEIFLTILLYQGNVYLDMSALNGPKVVLKNLGGIISGDEQLFKSLATNVSYTPEKVVSAPKNVASIDDYIKLPVKIDLDGGVFVTVEKTAVNAVLYILGFNNYDITSGDDAIKLQAKVTNETTPILFNVDLSVSDEVDGKSQKIIGVGISLNGIYLGFDQHNLVSRDFDPTEYVSVNDFNTVKASTSLEIDLGVKNGGGIDFSALVDALIDSESLIGRKIAPYLDVENLGDGTIKVDLEVALNIQDILNGIKAKLHIYMENTAFDITIAFTDLTAYVDASSLGIQKFKVSISSVTDLIGKFTGKEQKSAQNAFYAEKIASLNAPANDYTSASKKMGAVAQLVFDKNNGIIMTVGEDILFSIIELIGIPQNVLEGIRSSLAPIVTLSVDTGATISLGATIESTTENEDGSFLQLDLGLSLVTGNTYYTILNDQNTSVSVIDDAEKEEYKSFDELEIYTSFNVSIDITLEEGTLDLDNVLNLLVAGMSADLSVEDTHRINLSLNLKLGISLQKLLSFDRESVKDALYGEIDIDLNFYTYDASIGAYVLKEEDAQDLLTVYLNENGVYLSVELLDSNLNAHLSSLNAGQLIYDLLGVEDDSATVPETAQTSPENGTKMILPITNILNAPTTSISNNLQLYLALGSEELCLELSVSLLSTIMNIVGIGGDDVYNVVKSVVDSGKIAVEYGDDFSIYLEIHKSSGTSAEGITLAGYSTKLSLLHDTVIDLSGEKFALFKEELTSSDFYDSKAGFAEFDLEEIKNALSAGDETLNKVLDMVGDVGASIDIRISTELRESLIDWTKVFTTNSIDSYLFILVKEALSTASTIRLKFNVNIGSLLKGSLDLDVMLSFMDGVGADATSMFSLAIRGLGLYGNSTENDLTILAYAKDSVVPEFYIDGDSVMSFVGLDYNSLIDGLLKNLGLKDTTSTSQTSSAPKNSAGLIGDEEGLVVGGINLNGILDSLAFSKGKLAIVLAKNIIEQILESLVGFPFEEIGELSLSLDSINNTIGIKLSLAAIDRFYLDGDTAKEYISIDKEKEEFKYGNIEGKYVKLSESSYRLQESTYAYEFAYVENRTLTSTSATFQYVDSLGRYYLDGDTTKAYIELKDGSWTYGEESGYYETTDGNIRMYRQYDATLVGSTLTLGGKEYIRTESAFLIELGLAGLDIRLGGYDMFAGDCFDGEEILPLDNFLPLSSVKISTEINSSLIVDDQLISYFDASETLNSLVEGLDLIIRSGEKLHVEIDFTLKLFLDFSNIENLGIQLAVSSSGKQFVNVMYVGDLGDNSTIYLDLDGLGLPAVSLKGINLGEIVKDLVSGLSGDESASGVLNSTSAYTTQVNGSVLVGTSSQPYNARPFAKIDPEYTQFGTALIMLAMSSKEVSLAITGAMIRSLVHGLMIKNTEGDIMKVDTTSDGTADYVMLLNETTEGKYVYLKNGDVIVYSEIVPDADGNWTISGNDQFRALGIYMMTFTSSTNTVEITLLSDRSKHTASATNYWNITDEKAREKLENATAKTSEFVMPDFNKIKLGYVDNTANLTFFDLDGDGASDYRVLFAVVSGTETIYVNKVGDGTTVSIASTETASEKLLREIGLTAITFAGGDLTLSSSKGTVTKSLKDALNLTEDEAREILTLPDTFAGISLSLDEDEAFRVSYTFTESSFEMGDTVESPIDPEHTTTGELADYITSIDILQNVYLSLALEVRFKTKNANGDKSNQVEVLEALVEGLLGMPTGSFDLALQDTSIVITFDIEAKIDLKDAANTRLALNIAYGDISIISVYYGVATGSSTPEVYADLSGLGLFKANVTGIQLASVLGNLLSSFVTDEGINVGDIVGGLFNTAATSEVASTTSENLLNLSSSTPSNAADTTSDNARIEIVFTNQEIIIMPNMKLFTLLTGIEFPDFLEVRASINLFNGLNNLSLYVNMDEMGNNIQIYLPQNGGLDIAVNTDKDVTLPDSFEGYGAVNGVSLTSSGISIGTRGLINSLFDGLYVEDLKLFLEKRNSYWARTSGSFYTTGYNYPAYGPVEEPVNYASAVGGGTLVGTAVGAIWGNDKYAGFRGAADNIGETSGTTAKRTTLKLNRTQENKLEVGINLGSGDQLYVRIKNNKLAIRLPSFSLDFKISISQVIQIPFSIDVGKIITAFYPNDIEIVTLIMNQLIAENRTSGLAANVGSIYGTITEEDGTAIEGVTVLLGLEGDLDGDDEEKIYSATTDSYGYYAFAGISEGVYEMAVKKNGYSTQSFSHVRVTSTSYSKAVNQDITLYTDTDATPYDGVEISGSVKTESGEVLEGATVIVDSNVVGTTDSYGRYQIILPTIYGTTHIVSIEKNGYSVKSNQSFVINDSDIQKSYVVAPFTMTKSILTRTVITGSIRDDDGKPLNLNDVELWLTRVIVKNGIYQDTTICPTTDKYTSGTITPTNFFADGGKDCGYDVSIDVNGNFTLRMDNELIENALGDDGVARYKFKFRSESYSNTNSDIIEINVGAYNDIGSYVFTKRDEHWSALLYGNTSIITGMRMRFGADKEDVDASTSETSDLTSSDWLNIETGEENNSDNKAYIELWLNSQKVSDLIMKLMGLISENFTALLTVLPTSRVRTIDLVETAYKDATGGDFDGAKSGNRYYPEDRYDDSGAVTKQYDIEVGDYKYSTITQWALATQGYQTKVMAATIAGVLGSVIENALSSVPAWIRNLAGSAITSVLGETLSGIGDKIASILPLTTPHNLYVDFQLTADGNKSVFTSGGGSAYGFRASEELFEQENIWDASVSFSTSSNVAMRPPVANVDNVVMRNSNVSATYTYGWIESSGLIHWNSEHSKAKGTWIYSKADGTVLKNDGADASYDIITLDGNTVLINNSPYIETGKMSVYWDEEDTYTFTNANVFCRGSSYQTIFYKLDGNTIKANVGTNGNGDYYENRPDGSFNRVVQTAYTTVEYKGTTCQVFKIFGKTLVAYNANLYAIDGSVDDEQGEIKLSLTGQSTIKTTGVTSPDGESTIRTYNFNDRSTYAKITLDASDESGLLQSISLFINGVLYSGEQGESTIAGFGIVGGHIANNNFISRGINGIKKVVVYDITGANSADADGNVYYTGSEGYTYNKEYVDEWVRTSTVETYVVIDDTTSSGKLVQRYYYLICEDDPKYESYLELNIQNTGISLRSSTTELGKDEDNDYFNLDGSANKTIYNPPYKIVFNDPYDPSDFTFYGGTWANAVGGERTNSDTTKTIYDFLPERHQSDFDNGDASESNGVAVFWSYDGVDFDPAGGTYYVNGYMLNQVVEIEAEVKPRLVSAADSEVLSSIPEIDPFTYDEAKYIASLPTSFFEPDGTKKDESGAVYEIEGNYVFNDLTWDLSSTEISYQGGSSVIKLTYGIKGNTNNPNYKSSKATIDVPVKVVNRTVTGATAYVKDSIAGIYTKEDGTIAVEFDPYVAEDPRASLREVDSILVTTKEGKETERQVVSVNIMSMWTYNKNTDDGKDYVVEYTIADELGNRQTFEVNVHISSKEIVSTSISAITKDARTITPYASATASGSIYDRDTGLVLPSVVTVNHEDGTTTDYYEDQDFVYGVHVEGDNTVYTKDSFNDVFTALESKTYVLAMYSIDRYGNRTTRNTFDSDMFRTELYVEKAVLSGVANLIIAPETRTSLPETYKVSFNDGQTNIEVKVEWSIDVEEILYTLNGGVYRSSVTVVGALFEDQKADNVQISVKRMLIDSIDLGSYTAINPYNAYTELGALLRKEGNALRIFNSTENITEDVFEIVSYEIVEGLDLDSTDETMLVKVQIGNKGYSLGKHVWLQEVYQKVNRQDVSDSVLYSTYKNTASSDVSYSGISSVKILNAYTGKLPSEISLSENGDKYSVSYDYSTIKVADATKPVYQQSSYTIEMIPSDFANARKTVTVYIERPMSKISSAPESVSFNGGSLTYENGEYKATYKAFAFKSSVLPSSATVNFGYDTGEAGYVVNSAESILDGITTGTMPVKYRLENDGDTTVSYDQDTTLNLIAMVGSDSFGYIEIPVTITIESLTKDAILSTGIESKILNIDPYGNIERTRATVLRTTFGATTASIVYSDEDFPVETTESISKYMTYKGSSGVITGEPIAIETTATFENGKFTTYYTTTASVRVTEKEAIGVTDSIIGTIYSPVDFDGYKTATVEFHNGETQVLDVKWSGLDRIRYTVQGGVYYVTATIFEGIDGLEQSFDVRVVVEEAVIEGIYIKDGNTYTEITQITVDPYEGIIDLPTDTFVKFYGIDGYTACTPEWNTDYVVKNMSVSGGRTYEKTDDGAIIFVLRQGTSIQNFPMRTVVKDRSILSEENAIGVELSRSDSSTTTEWIVPDTSTEKGSAEPTYNKETNTFVLSMNVNPYKTATGAKYSEDVDSSDFYFFRSVRVKVKDGDSYKYLTYNLQDDEISYNIYDRSTGLKTNLNNLYLGRDVVVEMTVNSRKQGTTVAKDSTVNIIINVHIYNMTYEREASGFKDEYLVDMYGEYFSENYASYDESQGQYLPYTAIGSGLSLEEILKDGFQDTISIATKDGIVYEDAEVSFDTASANVNFTGDKGYLYLTVGNDFGGYQRITITLNYINRKIASLFDETTTKNYYVGEDTIRSLGLLESSIEKIASGGKYESFILDPFMSYSENFFPMTSSKVTFVDGTVYDKGIEITWETNFAVDYYGGFFKVKGIFSEGATAQSITYNLYILKRTVVNGTSAEDNTAFSDLFRSTDPVIKPYDYLGVGDVSKAVTKDIFKDGEFTVSFTEGCDITYTLGGLAKLGQSQNNTLFNNLNVDNYLTLDDINLEMSFKLDSAMGLNSDGEDVRFFITLPGYGMGRTGRQTVAVYVRSVVQKIKTVEGYKDGTYLTFENYWATELSDSVQAMVLEDGAYRIEKPYYFIEKGGLKLPDRVRLTVVDENGNNATSYDNVLVTWNNTSGNTMRINYNDTQKTVGFNVSLDNQYFGFDMEVVPYILDLNEKSVLFDSGLYSYGKDDIILLPTTTDKVSNYNNLRNRVSFIGITTDENGNKYAGTDYGFTLTFANDKTWTFTGINGGGTARNNYNKWYFGSVKFGRTGTQYAEMTLGGRGGQTIRWALNTAEKTWVNSSIQSIVTVEEGSSVIDFTKIGGTSSNGLPSTFKQYSDLYFKEKGNTNYQPYNVPITFTGIANVTLTTSSGTTSLTMNTTKTPTNTEEDSDGNMTQSIGVVEWKATTVRAYPSPSKEIGGTVYICYVPKASDIDSSSVNAYLHNPQRGGFSYYGYTPKLDGYTYPTGMSSSIESTGSEDSENYNLKADEMYYIDTEYGYQNAVPIITLTRNTTFDIANLPLFEAVVGGQEEVYMLDYTSSKVYYTDSAGADWKYTILTDQDTGAVTLQEYFGQEVQNGIFGIDTSIKGRRYTIETQAFSKTGQLYRVLVAVSITA